MMLIKPSAKLIALSNAPLLLIEEAGRTCYKSEDKLTPESAVPFSEMILRMGHESVLEHASASVRFICDRGVSHEIVRHRIASYSQESTRYCDYNKGHVTFVIPPWCEDIIPDEFQTFEQPLALSLESFAWYVAMELAEGAYKDLRSKGWKPEQARSVLPNSLKTELVMTANLREWRLFFKLRTSPKAHPQMREITLPLLDEFRMYIPVLFEDII